jgi:hypothetical protein
VLLVDGIRMFANVIIDNLIQVDLVSCATLCQGWLQWRWLKQSKDFIKIDML